MKCKVIRGIVIDGTKHKPGDWSKRYEPNIIDVDGRSVEVAHYIEIGALEVVEADKPKPVRKKKAVEGGDAE